MCDQGTPEKESTHSAEPKINKYKVEKWINKVEILSIIVCYSLFWQGCQTEPSVVFLENSLEKRGDHLSISVYHGSFLITCKLSSCKDSQLKTENYFFNEKSLQTSFNLIFLVVAVVIVAALTGCHGKTTIHYLWVAPHRTLTDPNSLWLKVTVCNLERWICEIWQALKLTCITKCFCSSNNFYRVRCLPSDGAHQVSLDSRILPVKL